MKLRLLFFIPASFACSFALAQDTLRYDTIWETFGTPVDYEVPVFELDFQFNDSMYAGNDSATTSILENETGICVSIPIQIIPSVTPKPELLWYEAPPVINFVTSPATYLYWAPWDNPFLPGFTSWSIPSYTVTVSDPYQTTLHGGLFDTTPLCSSEYVYVETNSKAVSYVPPAETPEPSKPATLPVEYWYHAVLPERIRLCVA